MEVSLAMVTVGMHYDVVAGREADFEREVRGVVGLLRGAAGHTATHLYRDVERPGSYLIYSEWSDRAAFQAFTRSAAFAEVTGRGRDGLLLGPPRHHVLTGE